MNDRVMKLVAYTRGKNTANGNGTFTLIFDGNEDFKTEPDAAFACNITNTMIGKCFHVSFSGEKVCGMKVVDND